MNYDRNNIETKAKHYQIRSEMYEKQERLLDILEEINLDPVLSCTLALKGGTAINLFVIEGPRLSIDIDLDYTLDCTKESMLDDRRIINNKLQEIITKNGYILRDDSRYSHILDSLKLEYKNIHDRKDFIKLDINYLDRCHILPIEKQKIKASWAERDLSINCVNKIEIFASKMVALCTRAKARDLYDIAQLKDTLNLDKTEKEMLHKCVVFYSAIGTDNIMESLQLSKVENIKQYDLKTQVVPLILERKDISIGDLQTKVEDFINEMHNLNREDEKFIDNFQRGHYRPDLLLIGDELDNVYNHPMALFKVKQYENKFTQEIEMSCEDERDRGKGGPELGD